MRRRVIGATALAAATFFSLGGRAAAESDPSDPAVAAEAAVVASTSSVTLPLFGAPLVVDVSTDPGGNLVDVALNQPGDFVATNVKPNKVVFVNETEGVSVKVKARHGGERVDARAATLADVSGPGQWSGDIFETGETTTVDFTVGALGDGSPDITGVSVSSPATFTIGETEHDSGDDHDSSAASVSIEFESNGQTRTLSIKVRVRSSEVEPTAKLSIGLGRIRGAETPEGAAVGTHSWTGVLCDGTTATVNYTVLDDGTITDVTATPEADVDDDHRGVKVRFGTGERVRIESSSDDGQVEVGVSEKIHCDAADPSVNTPVDEDADDEHDGDGGDDHWGDGRDDDRGDGDGHDDHWGDGDGDGQEHDGGDDHGGDDDRGDDDRGDDDPGDGN